MKRILTAIPHITIIMSILFITLWILDQYNPNMNFLDSKLSSILMLIMFILSIITSILAAAWDRRLDKLGNRQKQSDIAENKAADKSISCENNNG